MKPSVRSLSLTAALLVATVVCCLLMASAAPDPAPQKALEQRPRLITAKPVPRDVGPPTPPVSFADPDGQDLILEEVSARTAIHGMLSLTELELRFRNPQARRIEGRFTCTLPPNAAISRFAKDINGHLMEGEVVERLRANQVYEQFLHVVLRDPALLEQDQGNRFSARIFPIEANAPVRLVLSYTALLPMRGGVRTYTLPLRGLPEIDKFSFRAFITPVPGEETGGIVKAASNISGPGRRSTAEVISLDEQDYTPESDIELTWRPTEDAPRARLLRAGDFYLAALRPTPSGGLRARPSTSSWLFYVDTSASSAEGAKHRIAAIESVLGALPAQDRVQLVAFDQEIVPLASGTAAEMSRRAGELLQSRLFLGGTDLGALLRHAARAAREDSSRAIVVASDLVPTLGSVAPNEIKDAIAAIPPQATVHALVLGSRENAPTAKALTAGRGRVVRVPFSQSLAARAAEAADELRRPLGGSVDLADAGAEWIYPAHFDDVAPGDEVIVLGKVKAGGEPSIVRTASAISLDQSTFEPLLEREAYRAYLEYLAEREASEPSEGIRRALATEQVRISVEQRVVIPRTTMLVLETEWDYQRFNLDRRALAAILTIDAGGIGRVDRRGQGTFVAEAPPPPPPMRRAEPASPRAPASLAMPKAEAAADAQAQDFVQAEELGEDEGVEGSVEGGVEGGVVGGVVGGVAGGVVGGTPGGVLSAEPAPVPAPVAAAAVEVPASVPPSAQIAPPPPPPPPPAPRLQVSRPEREDDERAKKDRDDWTRVRKPSRGRIAELEAELRANPRDRELYNQLSETLAAYDEWTALRTLALRWQPYDPENPQVYEVLGLADEHLGNDSEAARAHASLIEVAPAKPELLQRAGLLLLRARRARLAEAPLRRALEMRPDRANGYRHLALMLWHEGKYEEAARLLESALDEQFPNWYGNVQRVIREELGYIYRAWMKHEPDKRERIAERARQHNVNLDRRDDLRITLAWETDANDVDLHVVDPNGEECYYGHNATRSGLQLYEDITQGLGPEVIRTERAKPGTYHVGVRYFSAGPMGVSRGLVIVMRDDDIEVHPFRLVKGGGEIRYVTAVRVKAAS